jgi:hypothetical protein
MLGGGSLITKRSGRRYKGREGETSKKMVRVGRQNKCKDIDSTRGNWVQSSQLEATATRTKEPEQPNAGETTKGQITVHACPCNMNPEPHQKNLRATK